MIFRYLFLKYSIFFRKNLSNTLGLNHQRWVGIWTLERSGVFCVFFGQERSGGWGTYDSPAREKDERCVCVSVCVLLIVQGLLLQVTSVCFFWDLLFQIAYSLSWDSPDNVLWEKKRGNFLKQDKVLQLDFYGQFRQ